MLENDKYLTMKLVLNKIYFATACYISLLYHSPTVTQLITVFHFFILRSCEAFSNWVNEMIVQMLFAWGPYCENKISLVHIFQAIP